MIALIRAVALAASPVAIFAQNFSVTEPPFELGPMTVVATKVPRPLNDVAGTVEVIGDRQIADEMTTHIGDLMRYQPGISVTRTGTRFGWSGFNIRGIGGNRVAIEIDGVPLADQFEIGSFSNAGRDLVDVAILDRVEVLRGPASTLYGSDAIGGVVAYFTRDPESYTAGRSQPWLGLTAGYHGADTASYGQLGAAVTGDTLGAMISLVHRQGDGLEHQGIPGVASDTQQFETDTAFAKFTWNANPNNRLSMTLDGLQRDSQTDIRAVLGRGRFRRSTLLSGDDTQTRMRASLTYEFIADRAWLDGGTILAYWQTAETEQLSIEERAADAIRRERDFDYQQDVVGLELNLNREIAWGDSRHRIGYGLELAATETIEARDAVEINLGDGSRTRNILGERFPVRDFPITDVFEAGLYIQDEITLADNRWTVIPALRFDHYDLGPRPDTLYREDNPEAAVVSILENNISPRLGLTYDASEHWTLFAQYARGFRAPPFEDANIGLDIPLFNIRAIPNADLRAETSDSVEFGARFFSSRTTLSTSLHYSDFTDFIETKVNLGQDPSSGVILFQSQNLAAAHIYGAELRLTQNLGAYNLAMADFDLDLAVAWTRGENDALDRPLNSIDPAEAIVGITWNNRNLPWQIALTATLVDSKTRVDDQSLFQPDGYGIVDLRASYRPLPRLTMRAGLFNLTDQRYWRWASVRGLTPDDPLLEMLSSPGRHAAFSMALHW